MACLSDILVSVTLNKLAVDCVDILAQLSHARLTAYHQVSSPGVVGNVPMASEDRDNQTQASRLSGSPWSHMMLSAASVHATASLTLSTQASKLSSSVYLRENYDIGHTKERGNGKLKTFFPGVWVELTYDPSLVLGLRLLGASWSI